VPPGFPWQAHIAGIGLIQQNQWQSRLSPSQGGDIRVAAWSRPSRRCRLRAATSARPHSAPGGARAHRAEPGGCDGRRFPTATPL